MRRPNSQNVGTRFFDLANPTVQKRSSKNQELIVTVRSFLYFLRAYNTQCVSAGSPPTSSSTQTQSFHSIHSVLENRRAFLNRKSGSSFIADRLLLFRSAFLRFVSSLTSFLLVPFKVFWFFKTLAVLNHISVCFSMKFETSFSFRFHR